MKNNSSGLQEGRTELLFLRYRNILLYKRKRQLYNVVMKTM